MIQRVHVAAAPQRRKGRKPVARWRVDGVPYSLSRATVPLCNDLLAKLRQADRDGETFDAVTGLPRSLGAPVGDLSVADWCALWLGRRWDDIEPRTRAAIGEGLGRLIAATIVGPGPELPVRDAIKWLRVAAGPGEVDPKDVTARLLDRRSRPVSTLTPEVCSTAADLVRRRLTADGLLSGSERPLGPATAGRHRKNVAQCLTDAAGDGVVAGCWWPAPAKSRTKRQRAARAKARVDVDKLPSLNTAVAAIGAMANRRPSSLVYQVMSYVMVLAGLRPSEVVELQGRDLTLPASGWGRIEVRRAALGASAWASEDEEVGDPKMGESRRVPIPPTLVRILRDYTAARPETGPVFRAAARAAADGSTPAPQAPTLSNWRRALGRVLPGTSIYDLRHLHATVLVREIPLGEAADRLGHSVETLTSTYIQVLQGDEEEANAALDRVFGDM